MKSKNTYQILALLITLFLLLMSSIGCLVGEIQMKGPNMILKLYNIQEKMRLLFGRLLVMFQGQQIVSHFMKKEPITI